MTRYVALLRGINVGTAKRVPMAELRELLGELGYENARTLLNSGNAVFDASATATEIQKQIESAIEERFGFEVDVVIRSSKQIDAVLKHNPLADVATDDSKYVVYFLSSKPDAKALKEFQAQDFTKDELAAKGSELYVWCPNNTLESPIVKALPKAGIADHMTARNWRTVRKIAELAAA